MEEAKTHSHRGRIHQTLDCVRIPLIGDLDRQTSRIGDLVLEFTHVPLKPSNSIVVVFRTRPFLKVFHTTVTGVFELVDAVKAK